MDTTEDIFVTALDISNVSQDIGAQLQRVKSNGFDKKELVSSTRIEGPEPSTADEAASVQRTISNDFKFGDFQSSTPRKEKPRKAENYLRACLQRRGSLRKRHLEKDPSEASVGPQRVQPEWHKLDPQKVDEIRGMLLERSPDVFRKRKCSVGNFYRL